MAMDTFGRHLLLDVWLDQDVGDDVVDGILATVRRRLTVVRESSHAFEPQGLTCVCILAESHFTLHTYPESRYLSMDVYSCNADLDLLKLESELLKNLRVRDRHRTILERGRLSEHADVRVERPSEIQWG